MLYRNKISKYILAFNLIFLLFIGLISPSNSVYAKDNVKGAIYTTDSLGEEHNKKILQVKKTYTSM